MADAWTTYSGAPDIGDRVCTFDGLGDGTVQSLELGAFPILIVRRGDRIFAFVNACPHQYLPLDHRGDRILSADGAMLRCTNHQAGFLIETGEGVDGFGVGTCLDKIPVSIAADGWIVIG